MVISFSYIFKTSAHPLIQLLFKHLLHCIYYGAATTQFGSKYSPLSCNPVQNILQIFMMNDKLLKMTLTENIVSFRKKIKLNIDTHINILKCLIQLNFKNYSSRNSESHQNTLKQFVIHSSQMYVHDSDDTPDTLTFNTMLNLSCKSPVQVRGVARRVGGGGVMFQLWCPQPSCSELK